MLGWSCWVLKVSLLSFQTQRKPFTTTCRGRPPTRSQVRFVRGERWGPQPHSGSLRAQGHTCVLCACSVCVFCAHYRVSALPCAVCAHVRVCVTTLIAGSLPESPKEAGGVEGTESVPEKVGTWVLRSTSVRLMSEKTEEGSVRFPGVEGGRSQAVGTLCVDGKQAEHPSARPWAGAVGAPGSAPTGSPGKATREEAGRPQRDQNLGRRAALGGGAVICAER